MNERERKQVDLRKLVQLVYKNRNKVLIGLVVLILVFVLVFFIGGNNTPSGVAYIKEQSSLDPEALSSDLSAKKKEERKAAIENGTLDVFGLFDNYCIFGDSRVMGFELYNFFPDSRVFASSGATILNVDDWLSQVQSLQPQNIFLSYGVNDMGLNLNETDAGTYGQLYEAQVKKILNVCPNSKIFVNSIIPATPAAVEKSPAWSNVDLYNSQLKEICETNGWTYIDNSSLADGGNASIYQADGIHFTTAFYSVWAQNMIDAME